MTEQMSDYLQEEIENARAKNDTHELIDTMAKATRELVDCQFKTSERVKVLFEKSEQHKDQIAKDSAELKEINITVKQLAEERKLAKAKIEGAQMMLKFLKWTCALGGGAGAGYVIKSLTAM